jgi:TldD protein
MRALDAARSAGATYADVRYRRTQAERWIEWRGHGHPNPSAEFVIGFGVRALFKGYWGYSALGGRVTAEDAARLGREATAQAKTGALGASRIVELAPAPVVNDGHWVMPVEIDPFTVSWAEKIDVMEGIISYFNAQAPDIMSSASMMFLKQEQAFASTDGSFYTQILYASNVDYAVSAGSDWLTGRGGRRTADFVSNSGSGWEYVLKAPFEEEAGHIIEQAEQSRRPKPVNVGRYDLIFDGAALAKLIDATLGPATELDRAMTYVANTYGTSFLNNPLEMLGSYQLGAPLLTISSNRSLRNGAATVKWDDEGVEPDEAVLVKDGILTDFQTTRESASWLADYYRKIEKPVRSHGGAMFGYVYRPPSQGAHNIVMTPSAENTSFDALCSGVKKGLAFLSGRSLADQQGLNAESSGELVYEITNGKLGDVVEGALPWTRAPELWKNLIGVGGLNTVRHVGILPQRWYHQLPHTVAAPAALFKNVPVTSNIRRVI